MFSKVLIANRGEIAVRIIATCREMGLDTVAVYSEVDAAALHVRRADEAYCIGPAPASASYLSVDSLLDAARRSGAGAVHPGYGFLAENADFAARVQDAGLAWIGPDPAVIALMGDKVAAKELAVSAGVPVVPGYNGEQDVHRLQQEAERIGYPVMVKAAAGGGGRGMRTVTEAADLPAAVEGARREARAAFGDDRVFLEKLLLHPRHIEIQILADSHGNAVFLGERDCTIQRRHQKVIEETPSPVLTRDLRAAMGEASLRLARAGGYVNAGTVEFLFNHDRFYFLEMNTRIQVEHPVTEMVTGLDLVRMQIEIAAGRKLTIGQLDVNPRGHAIEARVYAEDAPAGFLPATGRLDIFRVPAGPGIRNDVGVFEGAEVTPFYDPLLAKLIVHAESRAPSVRRLQEALGQYAALGVTTNLDFLRWVTGTSEFQAGRVDTEFVQRSWRSGDDLDLPFDVLMAAACFEATQQGHPRRSVDPNPWRQTSGWRPGGGTRTFVYTNGNREHSVELDRAPGGEWTVRVGDEIQQAAVVYKGEKEIAIRRGHEVETYYVLPDAAGIEVGRGGKVYHLSRPRRDRAAGHAYGKGQSSLTAPMPGTVVKVLVQEGQHVGPHEALLVLEAMKMEHVIEAPYEGVVGALPFKEGDPVQAGAALVRLDAS